MALSESQLAYRQDIVETLQLIASKEEQLKYQREVPIAYVSAEIFCHWGDGCYQDGISLDEEWCRPIFTATELQAMADFNEVLNQVSRSVPEPPWIEVFVLTPEWARLSEAATTALHVLTSTNETGT